VRTTDSKHYCKACYDAAVMSKESSKNKSSFLRSGLPIVNSYFRVAIFLLFVSIFSVAGFAATSLREYIHRLDEAGTLASDLAQNADGSEYETEELQRLTKLLPATEDIARDAASQDIVHVDNSWLHESIKKLDADDEEMRASQLQEISERLQALHQILTAKPSSNATVTPSKEKLQEILNRSEYKPDEAKASSIQAWLKRMGKRFTDWLRKFFSNNQKPDGVSPLNFTGMPDLARIFLVAALAVFLIWAFVTLFKRLRQNGGKIRKTAKEKVEILGEVFDADITGDDLIKDAAEMARRGDYRMAIRRAYLAMLYEMEQRGKLRLHRAKTNNDYLKELRNDKYTYPSVEIMTNRYERVWYGLSAATMEDYSGFIENYREVAR
jgi:Domain of unknown function (DUF4129)